MGVSWALSLFYANLTAHGVLLAGAVWCIAFPKLRVYPMEAKGFWFYAMWLLFYFAFASNVALVIIDWNTGLWLSNLRFFLGLPLAALGAGFVAWGIATLGIKNTSGLRDGFVSRGPYALSRNPQYVGDMTLFLGFIIIANSELVLITHSLTALLFVLAPFAEEPWLVAEYGDEYVVYRRDVPRFL
jgi:protein-S-isoprenylcysteine O-methyltransferase Ste14